MVEAARGPKLHPTSILEVYEVFEHLHDLWMGIWVHPYTVTPVQVGGGDFLEKWSSKIEPNDIEEPWLRLGTTTDCIPHPYWMYMKCFSTLICC
jgi:hypothetical protein